MLSVQRFFSLLRSLFSWKNSSRAAARVKKRLHGKREKTGDMCLGFYTSVFCEVKTHLVGKTSVFRQIKQKPFRFLGRVNGACGRTRTGDLRITNALLYQLSHASMPYSEKWPSRSQLFQYSMVLKIRQDFFENFS